MEKEKQYKKNDGQNRCRRCNRPLKDSNADYGWRCAQIIGLNFNQKNVLDAAERFLYNDYVIRQALYEKGMSRESFTTEGLNYRNMFVREEKAETKDVIYHVITDVVTSDNKFQVEYTVNNGAVSFKYEDNDDYGSILWHGGGRTVAKAVYDAAKELSPDNFFGRTVDGVNTELQLHYVAYKAGILREKASPANIGGMKSPGFDNNAWLFEGVNLTEDIFDPKAIDIVKFVDKIWRYYKK